MDYKSHVALFSLPSSIPSSILNWRDSRFNIMSQVASSKYFLFAFAPFWLSQKLQQSRELGELKAFMSRVHAIIHIHTHPTISSSSLSNPPNSPIPIIQSTIQLRKGSLSGRNTRILPKNTETALEKGPATQRKENAKKGIPTRVVKHLERKIYICSCHLKPQTKKKLVKVAAQPKPLRLCPTPKMIPNQNSVPKTNGKEVGPCAGCLSREALSWGRYFRRSEKCRFD